MKQDESVVVSRVEQALGRIHEGQMVILVDDEDRENEGDLVMAAEKVSAEAISFMAVHGRGLICLALTPNRCDALDLPPMVRNNTARYGTAFTISIEAATGVSTGISAADRARTIQVAVDPASKPWDLARPGHVFPLRAKAGGVLVRTGQTEGSVDLARMAGLGPAGIVCEIMNDDGTMARRPQLEVFAEKHGLMIVSVADLIRYRLLRESLVRRTREVEIEIGEMGRFKAVSYRNDVDELEHLALVRGTPVEDRPVLGRVHQEAVLGDVFRVGESRPKLEQALRAIADADCGVLVYLQKPAPRLEAELAVLAGATAEPAPVPPERVGLPSDLREFGIGAQILLDQNVRLLRLMTNSPLNIKGLEGYGIRVVERVPLATKETKS